MMRVVLWLCASLFVCPTQAYAQTLVVQRTAASDGLLKSLRALTLEAGLELSVADDPPCSTALEPAAPVRVVLRWQPAAEIEVCFGRGTAEHRRSLGLAHALDANAREQIVAVIESGVQALQDGASQPTAAATVLPAQVHTAVEKPGVEAGRPNQATRLVPRWSLGAGYGAGWLSDGLAQRLSVWGALALSPAWAAAVALGYVPWSERAGDVVSVSLRVFELRLVGITTWPVTSALAFQLGAGPSLQHVSYRANAPDGRTVRYVDILLNIQCGPRLTLTRLVWLSLSIGADLTVVQRDFEVSQGSDLVHVNSASRVRPRLDIQLGIFL